MSEDDLKARISMLDRDVAVMASRMEGIVARLEKIEKSVTWATVAIVGSVIAAVLKQVGL